MHAPPLTYDSATAVGAAESDVQLSNMYSSMDRDLS